MSSCYGKNLKLSIFGQSHGQAIGMTLDGIPAGLPVDIEKLQKFLNRRAPGQHEYATVRQETDVPEFLCGVIDGFTCGAPITAIVKNTNVHSEDYCKLKDTPRPGHADFTAQTKYGGFQDASGGGHFSGRLTASLCVAGGLCKQWLDKKGIRIAAHIVAIGNVVDEGSFVDWVDPQLDIINHDFPVINPQTAEKMKKAIIEAKREGDSIGGIIECIATGLPAGLGDPMFDGMESRLAQIIYGIPAVKGLDFGSGFSGAYLHGSENNDPYAVHNGKIVTLSNNDGGIQGGITNGMPIVFSVAIKPTPSISLPQNTVSLGKMENTIIEISGRHDPCIVPRAVPVIEAAAAIAIYDAWLAYFGGKS